jgi:DNA polymerase III subunit epsilon
MYLIFDCSGIDKPKSWKAPFSDTFNWPRVIHISWIILDKDLKPTNDFDHIIIPDGFSFDEKIQKKCSIDQEDIDNKGVPLTDALEAFEQSLIESEYVIAHNMNFNENVLAAEYLRKGIRHSLFLKERICLMQESTFYCKLKGKGSGYKWPSLTELHAIIFKKAYSPPNNARADVIAATRCFKALMMGKQLDDLFDDED